VVDRFGLQRTARRAADQDVAAARFSYEATRATLATDVATALFQARGYAIQLADARETLRIATDLATSGDLSASHGLTSTSDAARLQTDVATARAEVDRLTAVELAARRSLLALIGRGFDPLEQLQVEAMAPPPPTAPRVAPGDLLRRRPDVRQAEAQLRSAADNLKLDRLALFPSFSLTPGVQLAKTGGIYALTSTIWTVGLGASEPVLDRPRLLAVIRGQKARGEAAVAAYEKAVQDAYRDAENGLATFAADTKRSSDLQLAEGRARFAFEAKRRGYDLGLTDLTTLLESERTWRQTLSAYNGARTTALVDAATLFQALGGGWSPEPTSAPGKA
jgi:outer membrane protein TolC